MKYQILFSGKHRKSIINLSSSELAQRVIKANQIKINLAIERDIVELPIK